MKTFRLAGWAVVLSLGMGVSAQVFGQAPKDPVEKLPAPSAPNPDAQAAPAAPVAPALPAAPVPPPPDAAPADVTAPPETENWFHQGDLRFRIGGQYRVLPNFSDFDFQPKTIGNDHESENFANQRLRLWLTVAPNENVEGYIQVQIGGFLWGDNYEFPKTFAGPFSTVPGDQIGIMLRRAWLAYHDDDVGQIRVGILDWHDSFGDTLASSDYEFDVAGIEWTKKFKEMNDLKLVVGAFVLVDDAFFDGTDTPGNHDAFLFTFDADQPLLDKVSVGASWYWIQDNGGYSYPTAAPYASSWDMWFGLRASYKGDVPLNGFVLFNPGERNPLPGGAYFSHEGWAAKLEAGPVCVGPGKFSVQSLYATGDGTPGVGNSTEFRTVAQTYRDNFGAQGYWSYLYITSPNGPADVKDLGVSLQNQGYGLFTMQAKYEYPICRKLTGISAAGWLWSSSSNATSGSTQIGPEVAQQVTYDFGGGLKADLGAAYLFTGDFYKAAPGAPKPDNLWMVFSRVQLEF